MILNLTACKLIIQTFFNQLWCNKEHIYDVESTSQCHQVKKTYAQTYENILKS